ncbi:hypothetical protein [Acetobacter fallax]|uniref:Uncharacterized protein n=1 Tax=Acetobacter fallax TaxID=1737473 RepID=A0ABX0KAB6_9PROT|nr:hypothetical protein [Acetobacter fallax]NHO33340.1 hypothetical protein [Acetobacter fallax]NHO36961.1 hypothetical protein [Acetobacter fallax]
MDYTTAPGYVTVDGVRQYADRDPANGVPGTALIAADRTATMVEIMTVIAKAGLAPSATDLTQLWQAIVSIAKGVEVEGEVGFTPVQQGGRPDQGANKINIGLAADLAGILRFAVDGNDLGFLVPSSPAAADRPVRNLIDSTGSGGPWLSSDGWNGRLVGLPDYSSAWSAPSTWVSDTGAASGYRRSPDGLIMQSGVVWHDAPTGALDPTVYEPYFAIPFPNGVRRWGVNILDSANPSGVSICVDVPELDHMMINCTHALSCVWFADGY